MLYASWGGGGGVDPPPPPPPPPPGRPYKSDTDVGRPLPVSYDV